MQEAEKYPSTIRILHWLMAVLILGLIAVGFYMTELDKADPARGTLYMLHKSTGLVVLTLVCVRLYLRLTRSIPALPLTIAPGERFIAHTAHRILYALAFLVPILGWWTTNSFGFPTPFYGLTLPRVFPVHREWGETLGELHGYAAYTLLGLVMLHAAGACKHLLTDGYNGFRRMW